MYKKQYRLQHFFTFLLKRSIRIEPPYLLTIIPVLVLRYLSTLSPYYRGKDFSFDFLGGRLLNISENFIFNDPPRLLIILIAIMVAHTLPWIFYHLIEKTALNWSKKIEY